MTVRLIGHSVASAEGVILTVDEAVSDFLHRSRRELSGMSYTTLTHKDDIDWNIRKLECLGQREATVQLSKRYVRPDGEKLWSIVQVSRLASPTFGNLMVGTIFCADPTSEHFAPAVLWREAHRQRHIALQKAEQLGSALFQDSGWLVLLELYIAESEGRLPGENATPDLAANPPFARWLRALASMKLVEPARDRPDQYQLTATGLTRVENLLIASMRP